VQEEISAFQWQVFNEMGLDMAQFVVPAEWSSFAETHPESLTPGISSDFFPGVGGPSGFGPDIVTPFPETGGFQGGPDGFDFDEPFAINPGEVHTSEGGFDFGGFVGDILDPLNIFGSGGSPSPVSPQTGGLGMVQQFGVALPKLLVAFNLIGQAVKRTNGRIPMGKSFLSRIMQLGTGITLVNILPIDLWPFNNSSDKEQVMDMVTDALENGAIEDNRAYNRGTGTLAPMRAVIILYDRMGESVERMYAVSFRPVNGRTASRSAIRQTNVVRRRRTARRRSS